MPTSDDNECRQVDDVTRASPAWWSGWRTKSFWTSERFQFALPWAALAAILVTTGVTYRGVIDNGFALDDFHTVVTNRSLDSLANAERWFLSPDAVSGRGEIRGYRPVLMASYAWDRAVWDEGPAGYHLSNLLVHGGVVVLVFVLARRLWAHSWAAVGSSLWVAVHPLNSEAVNYITARSSSLMTLFSLAAVWLYDLSVDSPATSDRRQRWIRVFQRGGAWGMALAAMGTKEAAAVIPLLVMAWDRARSGERGRWRDTITRSLPFWVLTAAFLGVRTMVLGDAVGAPFAGASIIQDALFAVKIVLSSFGHWFWPTGLALDHAWPFVIGAGEGALLVAGVVGAGLGTWFGFRVDRRVGWCLVWFWTSLLPVAVLAFVTRLTLYQEHRVYLGGVTVAWIAGGFLVWCAKNAARHRVTRVAAMVLLAGLIMAAVRADAVRTVVWSDSEHLWEDVLAKYPRSALGYNARGLRLLEAGRVEEAREAFERSLKLDPGLASTHNYLGTLYGRSGEIERAIAEFQIALVMIPGDEQARINLGKAYEQAGRSDLAFAVYEQLLRDRPNAGPALERMGVLLERQGRLAEAAERYRKVLAINPTDEQASLVLGGVWLRLAHWDDAREVLSAVVSRHPDSYMARLYLGGALEGLGQPDEALDTYRAAATIRPENPDPHFLMAVVHSKCGRWADAESEYERALALDPSHFSSHLNLALVAEQLGDRARAAAHYRAFVATAPPDAPYDAPRGRAKDALTRLGRQGG